MQDIQTLDQIANSAWKDLKRGASVDPRILSKISDAILAGDSLPNSPSAVRVFALTSNMEEVVLTKFRQCLIDETVDEFLKEAVITAVSTYWRKPEALVDLLPRFFTSAAWHREQTAAIAAVSAVSKIQSEACRAKLAALLSRELEMLDGVEGVRAKLLARVVSEWKRGLEGPVA